MKKEDLKPGYFVFGNKGAVWSNECHIAKAGLHSTTLCGTPMLSRNYGVDEEHIGCEECIAAYEKIVNVQSSIELKAVNFDDLKPGDCISDVPLNDVVHTKEIAVIISKWPVVLKIIYSTSGRSAGEMILDDWLSGREVYQVTNVQKLGLNVQELVFI